MRRSAEEQGRIGRDETWHSAGSVGHSRNTRRSSIRGRARPGCSGPPARSRPRLPSPHPRIPARPDGAHPATHAPETPRDGAVRPGSAPVPSPPGPRGTEDPRVTNLGPGRIGDPDPSIPPESSPVGPRLSVDSGIYRTMVFDLVMCDLSEEEFTEYLRWAVAVTAAPEAARIHRPRTKPEREAVSTPAPAEAVA